MLSLGTELFFAFWIASYSVGLPAGAPPPARAATSMFLISLANSLPRRASTTAFLCLVVAHLEWPDIATPLSRTVPDAAGHRHEEPVYAKVTGQFGMEGRGEQVSLSNRDDSTGGGPSEGPAPHGGPRPPPAHPGRPG